MKTITTPILLAFALLTTLPVAQWLPVTITERAQGRSVACYPLVGGVIGLILAGLAGGIGSGGAPMAVAALIVILWVGLTGALHLDGLADAADGWFAGHRDPARCLAVMKEPTAGPMAVVALVLVLLGKWAALATLIGDPVLPMTGVLITVPLLARAAAAGLMATTAYRRAEGIARAQAATRPRSAIAAAGLVGLLFASFCLGTTLALCLAGAAIALTAGWRALWVARIGGYTGDIAGALIEIVEAALLLGLAVLVGP